VLRNSPDFDIQVVVDLTGWAPNYWRFFSRYFTKTYLLIYLVTYLLRCRNTTLCFTRRAQNPVTTLTLLLPKWPGKYCSFWFASFLFFLQTLTDSCTFVSKVVSFGVCPFLCDIRPNSKGYEQIVKKFLWSNWRWPKEELLTGQRRKPETGRVPLPTVEQVVTTFLLKAHVQSLRKGWLWIFILVAAIFYYPFFMSNPSVR